MLSPANPGKVVTLACCLSSHSNERWSTSPPSILSREAQLKKVVRALAANTACAPNCAKPVAEVCWPRHGIIQEIGRQILKGSAELSFGDGSRRGASVQLTCFTGIWSLVQETNFIAEIPTSFFPGLPPSTDCPRAGLACWLPRAKGKWWKIMVTCSLWHLPVTLLRMLPKALFNTDLKITIKKYNSLSLSLIGSNNHHSAW